MELTLETQIEIAKTKINNNQQQIYSLRLDTKCAEALKDEQWKERIRKSSKRFIQIIEVLQEEMSKLENAVSTE